MRNEKKCPKCGGTEIYSDNGLSKSGDRSAINISNWKRLFIATYICLDCGYLEEYADSAELKDKKLLDKIKENWRKI